MTFMINQKRTIIRVTVTRWCVFLLMLSCGKKSDQTSEDKNQTGGDAQISGTTSSDDPTVYKTADQSVQIGGVNLTGVSSSSTYTIIATGRLPERDVVLASTTSSDGSFSFYLRHVNYPVTLSVTEPNGTVVKALVPPQPLGVLSRNVVANPVSDLVNKIFEVTLSNARNGDPTASAIVSNQIFPFPAAAVVAGAVITTINAQKAKGVSAAPIDLTALTKALISTATTSYQNDTSLAVKTNVDANSIYNPALPENASYPAIAATRLGPWASIATTAIALMATSNPSSVNTQVTAAVISNNAAFTAAQTTANAVADSTTTQTTYTNYIYPQAQSYVSSTSSTASTSTSSSSTSSGSTSSGSTSSGSTSSSGSSSTSSSGSSSSSGTSASSSTAACLGAISGC